MLSLQLKTLGRLLKHGQHSILLEPCRRVGRLAQHDRRAGVALWTYGRVVFERAAEGQRKVVAQSLVNHFIYS